MQSCPRDHWPHYFSKNNVRSCTGEAMIVYAVGKSKGAPIYAGDLIMLFYGGKGWVSASSGHGDRVTTRSCPSEKVGDKNPSDTWQFTTHDWRLPDKDCEWEKWRIYKSDFGTGLIRKGDMILLRRYGSQRSWLSADDKKVRVRDCPGGNYGKNTRTGRHCTCESFKVHSIDYHYRV